MYTITVAQVIQNRDVAGTDIIPKIDEIYLNAVCEMGNGGSRAPAVGRLWPSRTSFVLAVRWPHLRPSLIK